MRKIACIILALWLVACSQLPSAAPSPTIAPVTPSSALAAVFTAAQAVSGWAPAAPVNIFDSQNIFALVDGQADLFFAYGFVQAAVQRYHNADDAQVNIEVWQLAEPADAYGLYTINQSGSPVSIGNEGNSDPGRRLVFWQERYYVAITASRDIPDADLLAFARSMTESLPTGGQPPELVGRLPAGGLQAGHFIFFHEEISIQNEVWLGGQNLLGLSQETDGVVARYDLNGLTGRLLLVEYPEAAEAEAGLLALQSGSVADLVAAEANGSLLGAVIGKVDAAAAGQLLGAALQD